MSTAGAKDSQGKAATSPVSPPESSDKPEAATTAATTSPGLNGGIQRAAAVDGAEAGAVVCKCRNVSLRLKPASSDSGERGTRNDQGRGAGAGRDGEEANVEMLALGAETIRHKPCATFETCQPTRTNSTGRDGQERQSRRPSSTSHSPGEQVVRRCWICETDLYTARGKGRDGVLEDAERVWVDTGSKTYHSSHRPANDHEASSTTFSSLLLELPPTSSSFGRPPSSSVSTSTLYPALSPNTLAAHRTSSQTAPAGQGQVQSRTPLASHSHTLLPRLPDPFFLPPPFTPSHPLLSSWCDSAVAFLQEAQEAAERDVRQYIEVKAREMARVQEETRKEVELLWNRYAAGPGREEERERRRSRSVSISRRASRGAGAGAGARKASGLQMQAHAGMPGTAGSALDTDEEASPGGLPPSPLSTPRPQPSDNPIMREAIAQTPYTGGSLLSASISRNSYISSSSSDHVSEGSNASNSRAAAATDNHIDNLSQTYPIQGDQRAVAMSYVFSGMDEMEKRRSQAQGRRASGSRDRKEMETEREKAELKKVDEAVDRVEQRQGIGKDVHGKDSWIDEERNLAARYTANRAASGSSAAKTVSVKQEAGDDGEEGDGDEEDGEGVDKEGKTPKAGQGQGQAHRPRVTFQDTKPVREPKFQGEGAVEEVRGDEGEGGRVGENEKDVIEGDGDEDNVFDFELEDTSAPSKPNGSPTSAPAKAPARPKVQDMYESLLSTTLASDIPSHRAAHQRMKATGHNPYEFLRRRVSGTGTSTGDDDSLDGSEGSGGSGLGTPRGGRDGSRSLLATSMPVNIVLPHRTSSRGNAGLPPLEPKTSLSERQGLLVPGLRGAMRMTSSIGTSARGEVSRGKRDGEAQDGTPEATPRASNQLQGMSTATLPRSSDPNDMPDQRSSQVGGGRTRRGSRSASVSRERETFRQDPGAVLELVGEADDDDVDVDGGARQSGSPDADEGGANGGAGDAGAKTGNAGRERRESEQNRKGRAFMPPHIIARQESARSGDVGWRSMVED